MKILSWVLGVLGVLVLLGALYGRFHYDPTVVIAGQKYAASSVVLVGDSLLLLGVFLGIVELQTRK